MLEKSTGPRKTRIPVPETAVRKEIMHRLTVALRFVYDTDVGLSTLPTRHYSRLRVVRSKQHRTSQYPNSVRRAFAENGSSCIGQYCSRVRAIRIRIDGPRCGDRQQSSLRGRRKKKNNNTRALIIKNSLSPRSYGRDPEITDFQVLHRVGAHRPRRRRCDNNYNVHRRACNTVQLRARRHIATAEWSMFPRLRTTLSYATMRLLYTT
jgi:hypothetical protein